MGVPAAAAAATAAVPVGCRRAGRGVRDRRDRGAGQGQLHPERHLAGARPWHRNRVGQRGHELLTEAGSMHGWDIPGYTELSVLGAGGFGQVVLARHDASGTPVAIKYLRDELVDDPEF